MYGGIMKKFTLLISLILLGLFMIGCNTQKDIPEQPEDVYPAVPYDMHPAIMVDGELYFSTGTILAIEVDESVIQTVSSVTSPSKLPTKDGEINFPFPDAKYAVITDEKVYVVVMVDLEWERFVREGELLP